MTVKTLTEQLGMSHPDLVGIFYDEAKRIAPDEEEALLLTRDAVKYFKDHYKKFKGAAVSGRS